MVRLCRILSIAVLVVNLMVGCCAHDVQGCESKRTSATTYGDTTLQGQCPGCRCNQPHHGPRECQGRKFSFSPRRFVGRSWSLPLRASLAGLPNADFSRLAVGLHQPFRASGRLLLPVRLHLANQVLLI